MGIQEEDAGATVPERVEGIQPLYLYQMLPAKAFAALLPAATAHPERFYDKVCQVLVKLVHNLLDFHIILIGETAPQVDEDGVPAVTENVPEKPGQETREAVMETEGQPGEKVRDAFHDT
jgi:hypothetical protein